MSIVISSKTSSVQQMWKTNKLTTAEISCVLILTSKQMRVVKIHISNPSARSIDALLLQSGTKNLQSYLSIQMNFLKAKREETCMPFSDANVHRFKLNLVCALPWLAVRISRCHLLMALVRNVEIIYFFFLTCSFQIKVLPVVLKLI